MISPDILALTSHNVICKQQKLVKMKQKSKKKSGKESLLKTNFCQDCQIQFDSRAKYKYHRLKLHGKWQAQSFSCELCNNKTFSTKSNLTKHKKLVHFKASETLTHSCVLCEFQSNDAFNLKIHYRKHSGEKPFECDQCQRPFAKKSDLARHQKTSCTNRLFKCGKCLRIFHVRRHLEEHENWDENCGTIREKVGDTTAAFQERLNMCRLNTKSKSVIGINVDSLANEDVFTQRSRKTSCGICSGCERMEDKSVTCGGKCKPCRTQNGRVCVLRKCTNLVAQFDVMPGLESKAKDILETLNIGEVKDIDECDEEDIEVTGANDDLRMLNEEVDFQD